MKKGLFTLLLLAFATACGQSENQDSNTGEEAVPAPIEVELEAPGSLDVDENAEFRATVTQDGESVDDASEVEFEFWAEGSKDDSEMIEATHEGEGVYIVENSFEEAATYMVQSHVTAHEMHVMPKQEVIVGEQETEEEHEEEAESEEEHHHHDDGVTVDLVSDDSWTMEEEKEMTVAINQDGTPLADANVTLEVNNDQLENPLWINLTEQEDGQYAGPAAFPEAGTYTITVHVKKDDLHTHKDVDLEVAE
ncbi:FixH family protein [Sediminibacillus massiliensis]|uniref:FixH family protein n=1 Tax=Sediminibacillus massiliensis TaxID=1926277 RepID=UPI00098871B7|nr:FixH family protein [Sediminibacillus massiliensis]